MRFIEWVEQSEYQGLLLLDNADVYMRAMEAAWNAGYKKCHEQMRVEVENSRVIVRRMVRVLETELLGEGKL